MLDSTWKLLTLSALGAALAAPACRGEVIEENHSAAAATSGAGGTDSATSVTSGSETGGGPLAVCGGKQGAACGAKTFCLFTPAGSCGIADNSGLCQPRPELCTDDCPGVCGCDQKLYCNACSAQAAGVDVSDSKACLASAPGGVMAAAGLATNVPRFMIFKADPTRNVCFRLMVEALSNPEIGITAPPGWSVGLVEVTDHASDCALGSNGYPVPATGSAAKALKGAGSITFDNPDFPCEVTVHVKIAFGAQAPWVPSSEPIDADMLEVTGGCG